MSSIAVARPVVGPSGPLCASDPELMFPVSESSRPGERTEGEQRALAVCAGCPVLAPCRRAVLDTLDSAPMPYGVAGGMTREDRRTIRAARRNLTAAADLPATDEPAVEDDPDTAGGRRAGRGPGPPPGPAGRPAAARRHPPGPRGPDSGCGMSPAPHVVEQLVVLPRPCWQLSWLPPALDDPEERLRSRHYRDHVEAAAAALDLLDDAFDVDARDAGARVEGWSGLAELLVMSAALHDGIRELPQPCWLVSCAACLEPFEDDDATLHFPTREQAYDAAHRFGWVTQTASYPTTLVCLDCQQRAAARLSVADDVDARAAARRDHRGPGAGQLRLDETGSGS